MAKKEKNPYEGSDYDASGMPLGTTYADYDDAEQRRMNMVKDKVVKHPVTLNDVPFEEKKIGHPVLDPKGFNGALYEADDQDFLDGLDNE